MIVEEMPEKESVPSTKARKHSNSSILRDYITLLKLSSRFLLPTLSATLSCTSICY